MTEKTKPEKLTVSLPELAGMLGISKNHCYYLASIDALPVPIIRLGARIVVSRQAVVRLLDGDNGSPGDAAGGVNGSRNGSSTERHP